jgi:hypothetical protein
MLVQHHTTVCSGKAKHQRRLPPDAGFHSEGSREQ